MVHVFGHHDQGMLQRCGGYEDISITDALALLVEHGIELSSLDNDVIRQWQHLTALTALFEARNLAGRTTRLQSSHHLIPCHNREGEVAEDGQGTACVILDLGIKVVYRTTADNYFAPKTG